jgi:hypothetical protein
MMRTTLVLLAAGPRFEIGRLLGSATLMDLVSAIADLALTLAAIGMAVGALAWALGPTEDEETNR